MALFCDGTSCIFPGDLTVCLMILEAESPSNGTIKGSFDNFYSTYAYLSTSNSTRALCTIPILGKNHQLSGSQRNLHEYWYWVYMTNKKNVTVPMVGIVVTISPSLSLYKIVVFPAASSPTIRILISFLPKRPLKRLAKMFPILPRINLKRNKNRLPMLFRLKKRKEKRQRSQQWSLPLNVTVDLTKLLVFPELSCMPFPLGAGLRNRGHGWNKYCNRQSFITPQLWPFHDSGQPTPTQWRCLMLCVERQCCKCIQNNESNNEKFEHHAYKTFSQG